MTWLFWILFVFSGLLLSLLILIQEGKGGGLAEAFGGMGQETFGASASGVNKVTGALAGVFLVSIIFINKCTYQTSSIELPGKAKNSTENTGDAPPAPPAK